MVAMAAGLGLFAVMADPAGGYLSVLPGVLILGAGVGLAMSPSTAAITSSLPEEKQGVASALNDTVREMGGAVGIALIGSVLNSSYRSNVEPATAALPADVTEPVTEGIGGALAIAARLGENGAALAEAARSSFVDGMAPALLLGAGICVAAAAFTALGGPKTAEEAEPRLHHLAPAAGEPHTP
jgi:hypothetical protein